MKKISATISGSLLIIMVLLSACSKTASAPATNNSSEAGTIPAILTAGSWKVSNFSEPDEDKTKQFAGYTFTFTSDGKINILHNGELSTGSWSWGGISYYGVTGDPTVLKLITGTVTPLVVINRDWIIASKTVSTIQLTGSEPREKKSLSFSRL